MADKFAKDQKVKYPAADDGSFPDGTGVVESVVPGTGGKKATYKVRSDATGQVLAPAFEESDLAAVK